MRLPAFVCLSCLLACMDLDKMLRVDRCRHMDELVTFEPDPDYSADAGTGLLSPISYALQRGILLRREIPRIGIGRSSLQPGIVLK